MDFAVNLLTGSNGYQVTDNNVLFEPFQFVHFPLAGGVGEHLGGLLERCGGYPGLGVQGRFGDTDQYRFRFGQFSAHLLNPLDLLFEVLLIDDFPDDEPRVAGVGDADLPQHLPDDNLEVFVVDIDPLEFVNHLDFLDEEFLQLFDPFNAEYLVGIGSSVGQWIPGVDPIAVFDQQQFPFGNEVFLLQTGFPVVDDNLVPFGGHLYPSVDFRLHFVGNGHPLLDHLTRFHQDELVLGDLVAPGLLGERIEDDYLVGVFVNLDLPVDFR